MRSWKRPVALTFAIGVVVAVTGVLFLIGYPSTQDTLDAITATVVVAALIGLYALRRYARAGLVYNRRTATSNADAQDPAAEETRTVTTPSTELSRRVWW